MGKASIKTLPDYAELHRIFSYDPQTGILSWRVSIPRSYHSWPGKPAGTLTHSGYLQVGIARRYYLVHRLIWKIMTGDEPAFQIDHKDLDKTNNRWDNCRQANNSQNRFNSKIAKNNKSGVKGVCWDASHRAWLAYVGAGKRQLKLGRFKSLDAAVAARSAAASHLHGEFYRAS